MSARDASIRDATSPAPPPKRRRRRKFLLVVLGLLLVFALVIAHFLQPAQLTALVLDRAGRALKLDLRTSGPGSYALRPEPRLVLPGLSASVPGATTPFFRSNQVELALPWSTLRGGDLFITRIVMKSPDLDLPAMQRWLASRPPSTSPFKLPTLTKGIGIDDGLLRGDGWRIEHFVAALPSLADGKAATLSASGNLLHGTTASKFNFTLDAIPAGKGRGLRVDNARIVFKADRELPSFTATGSMISADAFALDLAGTLQSLPAGWAASIDSSYEHGDTPFSIALNSAPPQPIAAIGTAAIATPQKKLQLRSFTLGDPSRQPTLALAGEVQTYATPDQTTGDMLDASLHGQISRWPDAWPALPQALTSISAPVTFVATYRGPRNLSASILYDAKRADSELQGQFRIADIKNWVENKFDVLIPPVEAQLVTPRIDVGGFQLQGVQMEIHGDAAPPARQSKPASVLNSSAGKQTSGKPSGIVPLP
jgi:uncharacterized protein involved in outer membrane biogenesis